MGVAPVGAPCEQVFKSIIEYFHTHNSVQLACKSYKLSFVKRTHHKTEHQQNLTLFSLSLFATERIPLLTSFTFENFLWNVYFRASYQFVNRKITLIVDFHVDLVYAVWEEAAN